MYTLDQLIKGDSPNYYYFIPPEIVTKPIYGKTCSVLPEIGGWVHCRKINWYLEQLGWTDQEWYNVYILHIDRYDSPKCKVCGSPLNWAGKISWGYYEYCGLNCSQGDLANKPNFIKLRKQYAINYWKDPNYRAYLTDPRICMSKFAGMSWGAQVKRARDLNVTETYFYVTKCDKYIKIGSSVIDPYSRVYFGNYKEFWIYKGLSITAIDCEYWFKIDNCDRLSFPNDSGHTAYTEIFELSTLDLVNDYVKRFELTLVDHQSFD